MTLRFIANIDPVDKARALEGLDLEETLFIIVSKTFTTAETMLNAKACQRLVLEHYWEIQGVESSEILSKHFCAVSTNLKETAAFGISDENVFGFWDWVGGRYSVSSAVGILPLSLVFGYRNAGLFLNGMHDMD